MEKNSFQWNFPNFLKPREVNMDQNHSPSNPSSAEASVSVFLIESKEADPESSTNMDIFTSENITSSSPHTSTFFKYSQCCEWTVLVNQNHSKRLVHVQGFLRNIAYTFILAVELQWLDLS